MDRAQKEAAVAELSEGLKGADAIFAVDYRGISVTEAAELRAKLREADAVFKVVKNRLAKRAAAEAGADEIDELLVGPTALTLIGGDAVIAAKAIADFAKEHDELSYKGGIMDGAALDPEGFAVIARLPGVDVLRGQLVGVAASPITGLVRGLGSMMSGLAVALGQIAEQGLVSGEAPAEEPPSEPESDETEQPVEHAEEEAQPEEPDQPPADEPPSGDASEGGEAQEAPSEESAEAAETSEDENEQSDGESPDEGDDDPSSDESEDQE